MYVLNARSRGILLVIINELHMIIHELHIIINYT